MRKALFLLFAGSLIFGVVTAAYEYDATHPRFEINKGCPQP